MSKKTNEQSQSEDSRVRTAQGKKEHLSLSQ